MPGPDGKPTKEELIREKYKRPAPAPAPTEPQAAAPAPVPAPAPASAPKPKPTPAPVAPKPPKPPRVEIPVPPIPVPPVAQEVAPEPSEVPGRRPSGRTQAELTPTQIETFELATAANAAPIRRSAEQILEEEGVQSLLSMPEAGGQGDARSWIQQRENQLALQSGYTIPEGASESEKAAITARRRGRAVEELALLRTVGVWSTPLLLSAGREGLIRDAVQKRKAAKDAAQVALQEQVGRLRDFYAMNTADPNYQINERLAQEEKLKADKEADKAYYEAVGTAMESVEGAIGPQVEIVGVDRNGQPLLRQQDVVSTAVDFMGLPSYVAASAFEKGYREYAQSVQPGAGPQPTLAQAIRERRDFSRVARDVIPTPETALGQAALATAAAAGDIFTPDPVSIATGGTSLLLKGAKAANLGAKLAPTLARATPALRAAEAVFRETAAADRAIDQMGAGAQGLEQLRLQQPRVATDILESAKDRIRLANPGLDAEALQTLDAVREPTALAWWGGANTIGVDDFVDEAKRAIKQEIEYAPWIVADETARNKAWEEVLQASRAKNITTRPLAKAMYWATTPGEIRDFARFGAGMEMAPVLQRVARVAAQSEVEAATLLRTVGAADPAAYVAAEKAKMLAQSVADGTDGIPFLRSAEDATPVKQLADLLTRQKTIDILKDAAKADPELFLKVLADSQPALPPSISQVAEGTRIQAAKAQALRNVDMRLQAGKVSQAEADLLKKQAEAFWRGEERAWRSSLPQPTPTPRPSQAPIRARVASGLRRDVVAGSGASVPYIPPEALKQAMRAMPEGVDANLVETALRYIAGQWSRSVTRGILELRPGYFLNNALGNIEQIFVTLGLDVAVKHAIRNELTNIVPMAAGAAQEILKWGGELATGSSKARAAGLLPMTAAGTQRGMQIANALIDAIQRGGDKATRLLHLVSSDIDTIKLINNEKGIVRIKGVDYDRQALYRTMVEEGVLDGFDVNLLDGVKSIAEGFNIPARGIANIAEAIGARQRAGLFAILLDQGLPPKAAAEGVIKALYDYKMSMSAVDKSIVAKMLFPFWRWQKNANRQLLGAFTSPKGMYRLGAWLRGRKEVSELVDSFYEDYDEFGVARGRMAPEETKAYDYLRQYLEVLRERGVSNRNINRLMTEQNWERNAAGGRSLMFKVVEEDATLSEETRKNLLKALAISEVYVDPRGWQQNQSDWRRAAKTARIGHIHDPERYRVLKEILESPQTTAEDKKEAEAEVLKMDLQSAWTLAMPPSGMEGAANFSAALPVAAATGFANLLTGRPVMQAVETGFSMTGGDRAPMVQALAEIASGESPKQRVSKETYQALTLLYGVDGAERIVTPEGKEEYVVYDPMWATAIRTSPLGKLDEIFRQPNRKYTMSQLPLILKAIGLSVGTSEPGAGELGAIIESKNQQKLRPTQSATDSVQSEQ